MIPGEVAFGPYPGSPVRVRADQPPWQRWQVAVALGGQGHYAAAATVLGGLLRDHRVPAAVAAHAAVTLGAHRRQLGGHAAARPLDALGLRLAVAAIGPARGSRVSRCPSMADGPDPEGPDPVAARVDALVGLAADALGTGAMEAAARLLAAAESIGHPGWRPAARIGWVRAELALAAGRAADALDPAAAAVAAAAGGPSRRHRLKSAIVATVVRAAAGALDPAAAVRELDAAAAECARHGQLPLHWPALLAAADLLRRHPDADLGPAGSASGINDRAGVASHGLVGDAPNGAARRRHAAHRTLSVIHRRTDPVGRRLMGVSMWPAGWQPVM